MKKLLLFTLFLTSLLFPQLKEMEVKPTENRGGVPNFQDFPDKAGIIFYTQFDNLSFYSSYGIHKVIGEPKGGKYLVIIEPVKQTLEVRSPGHKSEIIKLNDLQPRDVLYYEVLAKKDEGISGVTEIGITVQVTPSDAKITIDGESVPYNKTKKISIGKHRLKVENKYYVTYEEEVVVSKEKTLFQILLNPIMVKIDGGTFNMGSNSGYPDEKPAHKVTLSSYMIGKYEVTQELWESVMESNLSEFKGSKKPVGGVSWDDAVDFCNKLSEKAGLQKAYSGDGDNITCDFNSNGYRLPTEAEWELAARGGKKSESYKYSGSNDINAVAWYDGNSGNTTHDVGTRNPNELGIYDMSGNVWEWCWDWHGGYTASSQTNPRGANSGSSHVLRGGGWGNDAVYCRVADRSLNYPVLRSSSFGFRLARTK